MPKHLLLNSHCQPQDWQAICGAQGGEFTSDFNSATCPECIDIELFYVNNPLSEWSGYDRTVLPEPEFWNSSREDHYNRLKSK